MTTAITVFETVRSPTMTITGTTTATAATYTEIEETVADSQTDQEHLQAIDISQLLAFGMISTTALTVRTNAATPSQQEEFTLTANIPVIWKSGDAAIFAGDVTGFYLTNASGGTATFRAIIAVDV